MEFISDISGQDIKAHRNNPVEVITKIRNWLNTFIELQPLPGANAIAAKYNAYLLDRPRIYANLHLIADEVQYADTTQIIEEWIPLNPI